jgi:nucleoside phosphorylase
MSDTLIDVVIITALSLERDAVVNTLVNVRDEKRQGRVFHLGEIGIYTVAVLCLNGMGNIKSASGATTAILEFAPNCILLAGITGGTKRPTHEQLEQGDHLLGDVLVAEQIIDFESGNQTPEEIKRRYEVYRSSKSLLDAAKNLSKEWMVSVKHPRPDHTTGRVIPNLHFGVVASGQKVVRDPQLVQELEEDWAKLIGIEMEGLGVLLAAFESEGRPQVLMAKAICDWADPEKNDSWQPYAADASATFLASLLLSQPFAPKSRKNVALESVEQPNAFSGKAKIEFCRKLGNSWSDLADYLEIPDHETAKFSQGNEAREIWRYLSDRRRIAELLHAVEEISRIDLKETLLAHP